MSDRVVQRRSDRRPVGIDAQCRTQSGLRDRGKVTDLSPEGCCVVTNSLFVKVGARVMIKPDGIEGISGIVRWIEGNRAGISFDAPLYGPVVDHMAERFGSDMPVSIGRS